MPSRAYNSFLLAKPILIGSNYVNCVNALSGLYLISTPIKLKTFVARDIPVSMPSRAYNSFLPLKSKAKYEDEGYTCQCPLGLITHFYGKRVLPFAINVTTGCQCPLGLITHFYTIESFPDWESYRLCQCPLGLITHFYFDNERMIDWVYTSVNALSGL